MDVFFSAKEGRSGLKLIIQTKAKKTGIVGVYDGMLKLAVASPPVDGKANNEVIAFLADFFNVKKSDVSIISGERSRRKICLLGSLEEEDIRERLRPFL
ncbi:MAG: DUF167 domain-containing protein [Desulfopila sp.]|nr:DUF167 domain-containing protein [Desulfopila sp.]